MSSIRVNNLNVGGTSADGVIQQVDSQGTPNTAGNKITLKTDGTNTIDGETTFNSNLRVNNLNIGGTSVDGVVQQVDSQGTPNTAGNKITLKADGTNTVDGETTFNNSTVTKFIKEHFINTASTVNASTYLGHVIQCGIPVGTITINVDNNNTEEGIVTIVNTGLAGVTIQAGTGVTIYKAGDGSTGPFTLAQHGIATIMYYADAGAYVTGVGLS